MLFPELLRNGNSECDVDSGISEAVEVGEAALGEEGFAFNTWEHFLGTVQQGHMFVRLVRGAEAKGPDNVFLF